MSKEENLVLTTREACHYLRISRPTYLKYLYGGKIKGAKVGRGWKVLKSELDRFLKGENETQEVWWGSQKEKVNASGQEMMGK